MLGSVATALKRQFDAQMKLALPQFTKVKGTRGPVLYSWCPDKALTFFLLLVVDPYWERFTVEVAWDESGEFPWNGDLFASPFESMGEGKRFRLDRLWDESGDDYWWELSPRPALNDVQGLIRRPEASVLLPKVPGIAREAVARIVSHAVPYFHDVSGLSSGRRPTSFRISGADTPESDL